MKVFNKKATYNYEILERLEAGVVLTGAEAKSALGGHIRLDDAHIRLKNGEAYLINAYIFPYPGGSPKDYDPSRTRKLLLHHDQLITLTVKTAKSGLTLVPLMCYNKHRKIKLEIGLARGKKQYEKRAKIKEADIVRELEQELKATKF